MGLYLPEGSGEIAYDLQQRLQNGDAAAGWRGDPNMWFAKCRGRACRDNFCAGWVLAQSMDNGSTKYIAHHRTPEMSGNIIKQLAMRDKQSVDEYLAEIDQHNDAIDAKNAAQSDTAAEEAADRLYDHLKGL